MPKSLSTVNVPDVSTVEGDVDTRIQVLEDSGTTRTVTANTTLTATDRVLLADATGTSPPTNLTATPGSGGTFTAGTYAWSVTAVGPLGESTVQMPVGKDLTANQQVVLTWTKVPGATAYRVFRTPFDWATADVFDLRLVTQVGDVATYTDTGTATTAPVPPVPPATNGGEFTVSLPTAVGFRSLYTIKAIGDTPNIVTLDPTGTEKIDGVTTLSLGVAVSGGYRAVTLASDGTNWRIVESDKNVVTISRQMNAAGVVCGSANVGSALVVIPCPPLIRGVTKLGIEASFSARPGPGTTKMMVSINECDVNGVASDPASNLGFWNFFDFGGGEDILRSTSWGYSSWNGRAGDMNLEDGAGRYLGLHLASFGANSDGYNGAIQLSTGAMGGI